MIAAKTYVFFPRTNIHFFKIFLEDWAMDFFLDVIEDLGIDFF